MAKSSPHAGSDRFSFKGGRGTKARVESIRVQTGKETETAVFLDALFVYEQIITAAKSGKRFLCEDPNTGEKIYIWVLPGPPPFAKS